MGSNNFIPESFQRNLVLITGSSKRAGFCQLKEITLKYIFIENLCPPEFPVLF